MDMQNVLNLQIPEGVVRTIHDKDNRLIWGRLAYDTKYAGDTVQSGTPTPGAPIPVQTVTGEQTVDVTGKNLLGMQNVAEFTQNGVKISVRDGVISLDGTANASTGVIITNLINDLVFKQGEPYTFSAQVLSGSVDSGYNFQIRDANNTNVVSTSPLYYPATYNNLSGIGRAVLLYYGNGRVFTNYKIKIQVEQGSSATTYEPYQSQSYPISLGSIELCKLGNYQDYIYKSGDDWYVHKEVGKAIFNGTESWSGGTSTGSPTYLYAYTASLDSLSLFSARQAFCSHFTIAPNQLATGTEVSYPCMSVVTPSAGTYAHTRLMIPLAIAANTNALRTWLGSHNTNLYYVLATSTDTKITDATLIGQLNAVHEWLTRYGYNATVSGNLPIIINKTNL